MGKCKQQEIRVILRSDNVEVRSKSIKWDEVLFIMLKGAILNEVIISMYQIRQ